MQPRLATNRIARFDESDTRALRAISSQLASTIENANLLLRLNPPERLIEHTSIEAEACPRFSGWPVQGIVVSGNLLIFSDSGLDFIPTSNDQTGLQSDFEQALLETERQLQELQTKIADEDPDVAVLIFGAHLLMLNDFPSEEEQFRIYRSVLEAMPGRPVTFPTLDVGGDKLLSYFPSSKREENPFLGLRAIRFSLRHQDVFQRQIRALLRSGAGVELKILFPLVSSLDNFRLAREIVGNCAAELQAQDMPHNGLPKLGAMVELPSIKVVRRLSDTTLARHRASA